MFPTVDVASRKIAGSFVGVTSLPHVPPTASPTVSVPAPTPFVMRTPLATVPENEEASPSAPKTSVPAVAAEFVTNVLSPM